VSPLALLLALALGANDGALTAGLAALEAGRNEEAARLLEEASAVEPTYDGLVGLGLARGHLGQLDRAAEAFARAIALDPDRPQAHVEMGGLLFLEKKYDEAATELERALRRKEDAYTRDLLASSLQLAGRGEEALRYWNALGQPILHDVTIRGLVHTRDRVARREVVLGEGDVLDRRRVRETRLRLQEARVFDVITLRPVPTGSGSADLEVDLTEKHGFARGWLDFVGKAASEAIGRRVRLRYANIAGAGLTAGAWYRWQSTRLGTAVFMEWARPLGLDANLRLEALRERQTYELEDRFRVKSHGLDLRLRRALDGETVGEVGLRYRDRSFNVERPDSPDGRIVALQAAIERRIVDTRRQDLSSSLRVVRSMDALGADLSYSQFLAGLRYHLVLGRPEGVPIEGTSLAAQLQAGLSSNDAPLDERFAVGGNREMELPLRAHRKMPKGILGAAPIARNLALLNMEVRQRVVNRKGFQAGLIVFYDGAAFGASTGTAARLHDAGVGLRIKTALSPVLRLDYGRGLTDGKNALFVGVNQVF
jgi:outer membrane protein assembly factor BamA